MSETDKAAIRIVQDLQKRIRNTIIALVGIFGIAILMAVFWGGGVDKQVDINTVNIAKNTEHINELSCMIKEFVTEQRVANESFANKDDLNELWNKTSLNLEHIAYWAEAKGYSGLIRNMQKEDIK